MLCWRGFKHNIRLTRSIYHAHKTFCDLKVCEVFNRLQKILSTTGKRRRIRVAGLVFFQESLDHVRLAQRRLLQHTCKPTFVSHWKYSIGGYTSLGAHLILEGLGAKRRWVLCVGSLERHRKCPVRNSQMDSECWKQLNTRGEGIF